jgi:hypothetical protein
LDNSELTRTIREINKSLPATSHSAPYKEEHVKRDVGGCDVARTGTSVRRCVGRSERDGLEASVLLDPFDKAIRMIVWTRQAMLMRVV